jgi:hypothetical protein
MQLGTKPWSFANFTNENGFIQKSTFQFSILDLTSPESGIYFNGYNIWHKTYGIFNELSMRVTKLEA